MTATAIAALTLACQACDLAAFGLAVRVVGIGGESNLAMASLDLRALVTAKLAGAIALAWLALRLSPRRVALLPALVGLVGAATALWALA